MLHNAFDKKYSGNFISSNDLYAEYFHLKFHEGFPFHWYYYS